MQGQNEMERFAAARPVILSRPETVVGEAERERILRRILATPGGRGRRSRAEGGKAASRPRFRRVAGLPAGIAVTAACALAAGGVATWAVLGTGAASPAPGATGSGDTTLTARVVGRTITALSQRGDPVLRNRQVITGWNGKVVNTYNIWVYENSVRQQLLTASGSLNTDSYTGTYWDGRSHGRCRTREIDYWQRSWVETPCRLSETGPRVSIAVQIVKQLKWCLANGLLKVTGHGVINGQRAISLVLLPPRQGQRLFAPPPAVQFGLLLSPDEGVPRGTNDTLWVNAATYLPLRETARNSRSSLPGLGAGAPALVTADYSWLPATPANLAHVEPPAIPAGFTQTEPGRPCMLSRNCRNSA